MLQRMPSPLHGACNGYHSLAICCFFCLSRCSLLWKVCNSWDLGRLGLQQVESDTVCRLVKLENLVTQPKSIGNCCRLTYCAPCQLWSNCCWGANVISGANGSLTATGLSALPQDLLQHSPWLQVLDLSENRLISLPNSIFDTTRLLRTLDLGSNQLTELPGEIFSGLSQVQELDLSWNSLSLFPAELFSGLGKLRELHLGSQLAW